MNTTKFAKRFMALVLAFMLVMASPLGVYADTLETSKELEVTPLEGISLRDDIINKGQQVEASKVEQYSPNDKVIIIVELEEESVLEVYNNTKTRLAVNEFKASAAGQNQVASILEEQDEVIAKTEGEVLYQYTTVLNGFAIETNYSELEDIRKMDGVKNAFVSGMYYIIEPFMESSNDMTGANLIHTYTSYHGNGTTVAIIDTGLEYTHEAFTVDPIDAAYDKADIKALLDGKDFISEGITAGLTADDVYMSVKVPYAYDYADRDTDVAPVSAATRDNVSHGTHVAGIAAGYAVSEEGEITFSGVAPQAQLLILKVFSDYSTGAPTSTVLAAVEDAVLLNADVINMSLGSDNGFNTSSDETVNAVYSRVQEAGINLMCAAGNATDAAVNNLAGLNLNYSEDVDNGIVSSPSTYAAAVSVASMDNAFSYTDVISAGNENIGFAPSNDPVNTIATLIPEGQDSATYEFAVVPGVGKPEDFDGIDVEGKIAMIQRGELNFGTKIKNAAAKGAIGVIVYDNVDSTTYISMSVLEDENGNVMEQTIPGIFIRLADGEFMKELETKEVTFFANKFYAPNPTGWTMSSFTSMGVSSDLTLKPEITAPGGLINSAYPGNTYETMSGTSMATPAMAGAAAIVRQYVKDFYPDLSNKEVTELVNQLLMSTANPVPETETTYYSPRIQGSGFVNIPAAVLTSAYISTEINEEGNARPKLNLGDDVERTGKYDLSFKVTNMADYDITYSVDVVAQIPQPAVAYYSDGTPEIFISNTDYQLEATAFETKTVTVPANSTITVDYALELTEVDKAIIETYYPNGTYVEGFVVLNDVINYDPQLSIPFLGFYGDWTDASVLDHASFYDEYTSMEKIPSVFPHQAITSANDGSGTYYFYLGTNVLTDDTVVATTNLPENFTISPNGDGWFDGLLEMSIGQLRNAREVTYTLTDEEGNVVYEYLSYDVPKTVYEASYGQIIPGCWYDIAPEYYGTDLDGNPLPDGTKLTATITANLGYKDREPNPQDTWTFPLTIDLSAPTLKGNTVRLVNNENGMFLKGTALDNVSNMRITAVPCMVFGSSAYPDYNKAIGIDVNGKEADFEFDLSSIAGNSLYKAVYLFFDDYGYNEAGYAIMLNSEEGLNIDAESFIINVDETLQLSATNNTDSEDVAVTWTSDNEAVATVDGNGLISGIAPGVALITASTADGEETAQCIIGVRENKAIETIDISVDNVTMKVGQAGNFRIESYAPFDVNIDETMLTVVSDNPEVASAYDGYNMQNYFIANSVGTATFTVSIDNAVTTFTVNVVDEYDETGLNMFLRSTAEAGTGAEKHPEVQAQSVYLYGSYNFHVGYENTEGNDVTPADAVYTWTISDPTVASIAGDENAVVNEDGSITANHVALTHITPGGHTVLTATDSEGRSASYTLYIVPNKVTDFSFTDAEFNDYINAAITVAAGESFDSDIYSMVSESLTTEELMTVTFESFDPTIAMIDENGVITGLTPGYTIIRAWVPFGFDTWIGVYVTEGEIDRTELLAAITDNLDKDKDDYVQDETWDEYLAALEDAMATFNDPEATQEDIDAATAALLAAVEALEERDEKALEDLGDAIEEAEKINSALYEQDEAWAAFEAALEAAKAVLADPSASNAEVVEATNALIEAMKDLNKIVPVTPEVPGKPLPRPSIDNVPDRDDDETNPNTGAPIL